MCISTAYEVSETGSVLAEYVAQIAQSDNMIVLTDIMGKETTVQGSLKMADLTRGILLITPAAVAVQPAMAQPSTPAAVAAQPAMAQPLAAQA